MTALPGCRQFQGPGTAVVDAAPSWLQSSVTAALLLLSPGPAVPSLESGVPGGLRTQGAARPDRPSLGRQSKGPPEATCGSLAPTPAPEASQPIRKLR